MFNISMVVLICISVGLGYSLANDLYDIHRSNINITINDPVITCDKKYYKAKFDCRKTIVNKHWEQWKQNKNIVREYCDELATKLYCSAERK
tara:strand:- start:5379 stop:5654 length:276 start_codon:yes stop_codon:yes gene_type:complete